MANTPRNILICNDGMEPTIIDSSADREQLKKIADLNTFDGVALYTVVHDERGPDGRFLLVVPEHEVEPLLCKIVPFSDFDSDAGRTKDGWVVVCSGDEMTFILDPDEIE